MDFASSIKTREKCIAVFGSSKASKNSQAYKDAYSIGKLLALNGYAVVNGGYGGVMEASAKGAFDNSGFAVGITMTKKPPNKYIKEGIPCNHLLERLHALIKISCGYIICPGGTGTLLELAAAWEMVNKGIIKKKPIIILGNLWEGAIESAAIEYKDDLKRTERQNKATDTAELSSDTKLLFSDFIFSAYSPEAAVDLAINYKSKFGDIERHPIF